MGKFKNLISALKYLKQQIVATWQAPEQLLQLIPDGYLTHIIKDDSDNNTERSL